MVSIPPEILALAAHSPPDLNMLPKRLDRRAAAAVLTWYFFPTSYRTLEKAPLPWRNLNGKALCETADLLAWAEAKVAASPPLRGGRGAARDAA